MAKCNDNTCYWYSFDTYAGHNPEECMTCCEKSNFVKFRDYKKREKPKSLIKDDIAELVYSTIKKWRTSPRFKKYKLEEYDNWVDDLVDTLWGAISEEKKHKKPNKNV